MCLGMWLSWSSPMLSKLQSEDNNPLSEPITEGEKSWIGGLLSLGATIGPYLFAFLQDKIGRKWALLLTAAPYFTASVMAAFGAHVALFYISRFIAGIGVAGVFTVLTTYIAEVSDAGVRGMLGSSMNNYLCFGLALGYCIGPYLSAMWLNLVEAILPAMFFVLFFLFAPDTPYFLIEKNRGAAESALCFLRSKPVGDIQVELKEIEKSVEESKANAATFLDIFKTRGTTKALIISVMLVVFQQLCGINIVLFYAQDIFSTSGTTLSEEIPPMIIGGVQFASSFVTPILVDRLGRKILLLISAAGMCVSETALGIYMFLDSRDVDVSAINFFPILTLVIFIITYNCGLGPLPWTVMAELFPSNIKSAASSFTVSCCWLVSFILTYFFGSVADAIGMGPSFWIFAGCTVICFLFTLIYVPETKGKNFQEIQSILNA